MSIIVAMIIALFLALALFTSCEKKEKIEIVEVEKPVVKHILKYEVIGEEKITLIKYQDSIGVKTTVEYTDSSVWTNSFKAQPKSFYYIMALINDNNHLDARITINIYEDDILVKTENQQTCVELSGQLPN